MAVGVRLSKMEVPVAVYLGAELGPVYFILPLSSAALSFPRLLLRGLYRTCGMSSLADTGNS
jgi:hypothetical protein